MANARNSIITEINSRGRNGFKAVKGQNNNVNTMTRTFMDEIARVYKETFDMEGGDSRMASELSKAHMLSDLNDMASDSGVTSMDYTKNSGWTDSGNTLSQELTGYVTNAYLSSIGLDSSDFSSADLENNPFAAKQLSRNKHTLEALGIMMDFFKSTGYSLGVLKHGDPFKKQPTREEEDGKDLVYNFSAQADYIANMLREAGGNFKVGSSVTMLHDGIVDEYITEGFDGQFIDNAVKQTLATSINIGNFDDYVDAFYPPIMMSHKDQGYEFRIPVVSLFTRYKRNLSGKAIEPEDTQPIPLIKCLYNKEIFDVNYLEIDPIVRGKDGDGNDLSINLLTELQYVSTAGGTEHISAPIKAAEKVDLIGLATFSNSPTGQRDHTDVLERSPELTKVYYKIDIDGIKDEIFELNTSAAIMGNSATGTPRGTTKDYQINLKSGEFGFILNKNTKCVRTMAEGRDPADPETWYKTSKIYEALGLDKTHPDGNFVLTLKVDFLVEGHLDLGTASLKNSSDAIVMDRIMDKNNGGVFIPTNDPLAIKIKNAISPSILDNKLKVTGYILKAQVTNSNQRLDGRTLTMRTFKSNISIPFKSGFSIEGPVEEMNYRGNDNDITDLPVTILANMVNHAAGLNAINHQMEYLKSLEEAAATNIQYPEQTQMGLGAYYLNLYMVRHRIDIMKLVDSVKSSERKADIRAAILGIIEREAIKMSIKSYYLPALEILKGGDRQAKATLIIGTDPIIGNLLFGGPTDVNSSTNKFQLTDRIDAVVVTTLHPDVKGKIICGFGIFDGDRNTQAYPLQFGCTFMSPPITVKLTRNNETIKQVINCIPRYRSVTNTPVAMVIEIGDLDNCFGKLETYVNTNTEELYYYTNSEGQKVRYEVCRGVEVVARLGTAEDDDYMVTRQSRSLARERARGEDKDLNWNGSYARTRSEERVQEYYKQQQQQQQQQQGGGKKGGDAKNQGTQNPTQQP